MNFICRVFGHDYHWNLSTIDSKLPVIGSVSSCKRCKSLDKRYKYTYFESSGYLFVQVDKDDK